MYCCVKKKVIRLQREELSFSFLKDFWSRKENRTVIVFIYEKDELVSLVSYLEFLLINNEDELNYYLDVIHNNKIWGDCEDEEISRALEKLHFVTYLILKDNQDGEADFAYYRWDAELDAYVNKFYGFLRGRGIQTYRVNFPMLEEIDVERRHGLPSCYALYSIFIETNEFRRPKNLEKITNLTDQELKPIRSLYFHELGEGKRKIYLVGPCAVQGSANPPGERLGDVLLRKLQELGLSDVYKLEFIPGIVGDYSMKPYHLLEYDISNQDLVIFMYHNLYECDLDLTPIYNSWSGERWLYQDVPIHSTITGNEKIVDSLVENIIRPHHESFVNKDEVCLWRREPQFAPEMEFEIDKYIKKVQSIKMLPEGSCIGAIVMNCNPFTYGHRYLIEYAAKRVDYLYLFVVEEDRSVIPFYDRYFLIKEGTKDIPNIILVPSGKFIISRVTFYSYFKKDVYNDNVSTEEDVYIFARYIAKGLSITKRFVGEEPTDKVTNCYNQTMKEVLPKYGIELIEIPRRTIADGNIISASTVRSFLKEREWEKLRAFVPPTTLEYLRQNVEEIQERSNRKAQRDGSHEESISELVKRICSEENIVIYTIGEDTRLLLEKLPKDVQERLVFADRAANHETTYFLGKQVAAPAELLSTYRDSLIVVSTVKFGLDIYKEFLQMGIDMSRCIFNTYRLA